MCLVESDNQVEVRKEEETEGVEIAEQARTTLRRRHLPRSLGGANIHLLLDARAHLSLGSCGSGTAAKEILWLT
jgi:hypothetical protein